MMALLVKTFQTVDPMKEIIAVGVLCVSLFYFTSGNADVYICNSSGASRYHYQKNCRGLNACKSEIKQITLKEAQKRKRTLCGWED